MAMSPAEQRIRAALPFTRLFSAYLPPSIANWVIKGTASLVQLKGDVRRQPVSADGVGCEWLIPTNGRDDTVLLYLHGGGFIYSASSMHFEMAGYLARKMGIRVLMVDYRLAPEHPFPAALDDCVTAYRWLLNKGYAAKNIVIGGDSAGGNLTLTSLLKLKSDGDPLPAAAACLSPVADFTNKEDRFLDGFDAVLHPRAAKFMNDSYLAGQDASNPLISPAYGDWRDLPPLLIHAGGEEILREDAVRVGELARDAGVAALVKIYPRMWHVWQINLELPQAIQSLDEIAQFLCRHLDTANSKHLQ
ncbi:MAG: alpha/beta hydrolase [Anaerolineaceae bacterium]|nr:alpha/beta hydrolase [Anaerolineaceae bacterium]